MTKKPPIFPSLTADVSLTWKDVKLNIAQTIDTVSLDNIHSFPELLTLLLLSGDSYNDQPINDLPENWKRFWSVESPTSGFFAAIYGNEEAKQLVLAHRGTELTNFGAIKADSAIYFEKVSDQMNSAMTCMEELKKKMKSMFPGWALIITGHSLGSYLADVTTFSGMYLTYDESEKAFCKRDGDVDESIEIFPYTVGFDGPGALQMLTKLRDSMDVRYGTGSRMRVEDLPADHYVSVPNLFNSFNRQVGGVYQISMKSSKCKSIPGLGVLIEVLDDLAGKIPTHLIGNFVSALEENAETWNVNSEALNRIAEALTRKVADWPSDTSELNEVNRTSTTDSRKPEDTEGPYALNRYQVEPTSLQEVELRYFSKPVQRFLHRIEIIKCYTRELDFLLENVSKKEKDLIVAKLKSIRVKRKLVICSDEGMSKLTLIPWLNAFHILHPKLIDEENFILSLYGQLSTRKELLQFKSDPIGLQIESISSKLPELIGARDTSIAREQILAFLDSLNPHVVHKFLKTRKPEVLNELKNIFEKECVWLKRLGENLKYVHEEMFVPQYSERLEEAFTSQVLDNKPDRISALSLAAFRGNSSQMFAQLELAMRSGVSAATLDDHEIWDRIECSKGLDKLFTFCVLKLGKGVTKILDSAKLTRSPKQWVKDIEVVYGNDYSTNQQTLREDINKGFGGSFVHLRPIFTDNRSAAATKFELLIELFPMASYNDLARGTGGSYRYLLPVNELSANRKITRIWLSRYQEGDGYTGDINRNRGGRYLYLNWSLD